MMVVFVLVVVLKLVLVVVAAIAFPVQWLGVSSLAMGSWRLGGLAKGLGCAWLVVFAVVLLCSVGLVCHSGIGSGGINVLFSFLL